MDSVTCSRIIEFDAAHRVYGHESKCATLHGHRYRVEFTAEAQLDSIGRVIDFSALKAILGGWIDENWDHNSIIFEEDVQTMLAVESMPRRKNPYKAKWNPTAENMAKFLLGLSGELLKGCDVIVTKVVVWETPNCFATASR